MGKVVFDNPNCPPQPAKGVYRWYYKDGSEKKTFYVGESGGRRKSRFAEPCTLARGALEAQGGSSISSDSGKNLDTDFIVGKAIQWLQDKGYDCHWQHIDGDPKKEKDFCKSHHPVLQGDGVNIRKLFKIKPAEIKKECWSSDDVAAARKCLAKQFKSEFSI